MKNLHANKEDLDLVESRADYNGDFTNIKNMGQNGCKAMCVTAYPCFMKKSETGSL